MPITQIILYQDDDGTVPILDWFDTLSPKARAKCQVRIERLADLGHELRRPEADFLRDGIHELRIGLQGINYRMLYFFHGNAACVLTHGLVKERQVPPKEIDRALDYERKFLTDPKRHVYEESSP